MLPSIKIRPLNILLAFSVNLQGITNTNVFHNNLRIRRSPLKSPILRKYTNPFRWWSGGAMVLGKLPVPGRPTILITVGQGPIALAVGAGGGGLDIFTLIYPFSSFSLSLGDGSI